MEGYLCQMSFDFLILKSNLFILSMTSYSVCLTTVFLMPHRAFILSGISLAARLNKYFISVTSDISPWTPVSCLLTYHHLYNYQLQCISVATDQKKLFSLGTFKATGPDGIPSCILKEFASELVEPVATILSFSR